MQKDVKMNRLDIWIRLRFAYGICRLVHEISMHRHTVEKFTVFISRFIKIMDLQGIRLFVFLFDMVKLSKLDSDRR